MAASPMPVNPFHCTVVSMALVCVLTPVASRKGCFNSSNKGRNVQSIRKIFDKIDAVGAFILILQDNGKERTFQYHR